VLAVRVNTTFLRRMEAETLTVRLASIAQRNL
jgi:hypothetical protein